jgi:hypothetical protein
MKKIILSTMAIATMVSANADSELLELKAQMAKMDAKLSALEEAPKSTKGVLVKSKVPVLKFSGVHYLGFVNQSEGDLSNKFETRRNYLQVKAYFKENPKDYMRITLDTHDVDGQSDVRLKYAYLYLDNILPNTGVEFGQAHRPWIDYEEHNAWNYRSISKVLVEEKNAGHLTNSADRGINFKTKMTNFSSELGLFNGEGYHNEEDGANLSAEWRLTAHLLGTGKKKSKRSLTYANLSFFGQQNKDSNKHEQQDLNWMGFHAVYNQPEFLVAAQYIDVSDADPLYKGSGYSVNGEYRVQPKWNLIARYDSFELDEDTEAKERALAGVAYEYNHNVEFIANYLKEGGANDSQDAIMLTASVEW